MPNRSPYIIPSLKISPRHPPVSVEDLADMMEIDLTVFGDSESFRRRLMAALEDAMRQGRKRCV